MSLKINGFLYLDLKHEARTGPTNFQPDLSFILQVQGHVLLTNLNQLSSTNRLVAGLR